MVGLRPRGLHFHEHSLIGQVERHLPALIRSDERRLAVGLFHQQRVPDDLQAHAFQLLETFTATHRVQCQGHALLGGFLGATWISLRKSAAGHP